MPTPTMWNLTYRSGVNRDGSTSASIVRTVQIGTRDNDYNVARKVADDFLSRFASSPSTTFIKIEPALAHSEDAMLELQKKDADAVAAAAKKDADPAARGGRVGA